MVVVIGGGAPPAGGEVYPRWREKFYDLAVQIKDWAKGHFQAIIDYCFPPYEPKPVPAELLNPRPCAGLPPELRPLKWDVEAIQALFQEGDHWEQNAGILLRAAESHLQRGKKGDIREFYKVLRDVAGKDPDLAKLLQTIYCDTRDDENKEGFFEREDLSAKGIYDALLWIEVHDLVTTISDKESQAQFQALCDLIPVSISNSREKSRVLAKVWYVIEQLPLLRQGLILAQMKVINDKTTSKSLKDFLKKDDPDLGLIRLAAHRMLGMLAE